VDVSDWQARSDGGPLEDSLAREPKLAPKVGE